MGRLHLESPPVDAMTRPLQSSGRVFLLADMNSAYASIETLFQPWLRHHPVVVLSANDGCVIARNPLAKGLGIAMGQPWHEVAGWHRAGKLQVFSSNFALYGDISDRFMTLIARETPAAAPYSIDEVFADASGVPELENFCQRLRQRISLDLGIPIAIGAGHTKTQAKLANQTAKQWFQACQGVLDVREPVRLEKLLRRTRVSEVWGIGPRLTRGLQDIGILTAWELAQADPRLLRRRFSVMVERASRELRGEVCFPLDEGPAAHQTIAATQSFGRKLYGFDDLSGAVAAFTARAAAKLRRQRNRTTCLQLFIRTSPFATGMPYSASRVVAFPTPTDDSREMIAGAMTALRAIYRDGPAYAKAGVLLHHLEPVRYATGDLFNTAHHGNSEKVMKALDVINARMGRGTVRVAREQASQAWTMRREFMSRHYTTRWDQLLEVW